MTEKKEEQALEIPFEEGQIFKVAGFTEAPASINFRFDWKGWNIQLTIRDEKVNTALKKMEAAIGHLEGMGAKPLSRRSAGADSGGDSQANGNQGEAPLCPTHGKPMLPSKHRSGEWYCPVKIAEDDGTGKPVYCKQKVKA
jgi:hypothetical protein